MQQARHDLAISTEGRGLVEITDRIQSFLVTSGVQMGLCTVFCRHTSASLLIQESADADVGRDLLVWLERLAPDGDPAYRHRAEGPDDMAAHLRSALTRSHESVPVVDGRLELGTWQGIFLLEHRTAPQRRKLTLHVIGE